ncbi:MAG: hypothetical protein KF716_24670 [Anaerolineae bacterium]|nr:hypothetical protein [Anaerolineae bacterium]
MAAEIHHPEQLQEIVQPMDRDSSPWAEVGEMMTSIAPDQSAASVQPMERDSSPFSELGEDFLNAADPRTEQSQQQTRP